MNQNLEIGVFYFYVESNWHCNFIKSPIDVLAGAYRVFLLVAFAPGQWMLAWVVNHDKFVHAIVFFSLSVLFSKVLPRLNLYQHFVSLMILAVVIEGIQYALANRGFSLQDIVFDLIVILGFYAVVGSIKPLGYAKSI